MIRPLAAGVVLMTAGCGTAAPPVTTDDTIAAAAAERKAVADTDGARRDAATAARPTEQN